jgi:hypothetical protein
MSCRDAPRADSETSGRIQPTPSEGRQSWHYYTPLISAIYAEPKHDSVMTTSRPGLLEQGRCHRICLGRRTVYGTTGRRKQRTPPPSCQHRRTFQGLRADLEQRTPPSTLQGQ